MSTLKYLLAAVAVLSQLSQTSGCSCAPPGTLCDSVVSADIVLHVKALERMDGPDINDDAVYTLETIQVFKAEEPGPNEYDEVGGSFFMTTGGNSALCGVRMETDGTEYLIDIGRLSDGTLYANGICGLFRLWSEDDQEALDEGCDDYDPCDGECGEFEECVRSYDFYAEDSYYCQDTCDPNPCPDGEACTLVYPSCSEVPCLSEAICGAESPAPSSLPPFGTRPTGGPIGSTESYTETLAPSSDSRGPPLEGDGSENDDPATPPPAPGTVGPPSSQAPPSSAPRTAAPTGDERGDNQSPSAQAPTLPPRGDSPTAPDSSQAPTNRGGSPAAPDSSEAPTNRGDSPTAPNSSDPPTTGRGDSSTPAPADGSRGLPMPTTAAPSMTPASDAGGASPLPEVSAAPSVSANAEGDSNDTGAAAPAVGLSSGFVAAAAAAVTTAAAACASL